MRSTKPAARSSTTAAYRMVPLQVIVQVTVLAALLLLSACSGTAETEGISENQELDAAASSDSAAGADDADESQTAGQDSPDQLDGDGGELERFRTTRWESVLVDGPDRLAVVFTGGTVGSLTEDPCHHQYELDVVETAEEITLTVHELRTTTAIDWPEDGTCTDEGHEVRLDGRPSGEHGGRLVVDGHDGTARTLIDESTFLTPGWLPVGWAERHRSPLGPLLIIAYDDADGSAFPLMTMTVSPVNNRALNLDSIRRRDLTEAIDISVRGGADNAVQVTSFEDSSVTIAFVEDDTLYQVTLEDALLTTVGLRFVEELRPPDPPVADTASQSEANPESELEPGDGDPDADGSGG